MMMARIHPRNADSGKPVPWLWAQSGVSLLEVLVSILILSIGLLGLAGLQTRALAYGQSALFRSQATILTDDMLDRIRVDRANALAGMWNTALADTAASFTGAALHDKERKDWKEQVEDWLPMGQASIVVNSVSREVTLTIQWDDSRARGEGAQQFVTQTLL